MHQGKLETFERPPKARTLTTAEYSTSHCKASFVIINKIVSNAPVAPCYSIAEQKNVSWELPMNQQTP